MCVMNFDSTPVFIARARQTGSTTQLVMEFQLLCFELGCKDKICQGNWAVNGVVLRVWSLREILLYMTEAQMQTMIKDMRVYLLT